MPSDAPWVKSAPAKPNAPWYKQDVNTHPQPEADIAPGWHPSSDDKIGAQDPSLLHRFTTRVGEMANDVKYGPGKNDTRLFPSVLRSIGFTGTETGDGKGVGGMMPVVGAVEGVPELIHGAARGHEAAFHGRGDIGAANEALGGAFKTAAGIAPISSPKILPSLVPAATTAGVIQSGASGTANALGASPESSELIGNVAAAGLPAAYHVAPSVGEFMQNHAQGIGRTAAITAGLINSAHDLMNARATGHGGWNPLNLLFASKPASSIGAGISSGVGGMLIDRPTMTEMTPGAPETPAPQPAGLLGSGPKITPEPGRSTVTTPDEGPQLVDAQPIVTRGKGGRMTKQYTSAPSTGKTIMNPGPAWRGPGSAPPTSPNLIEPTEPTPEILPKDEQNLVADGLLQERNLKSANIPEEPKPLIESQPLTKAQESPIINNEASATEPTQGGFTGQEYKDVSRLAREMNVPYGEAAQAYVDAADAKPGQRYEVARSKLTAQPRELPAGQIHEPKSANPALTPDEYFQANKVARETGSTFGDASQAILSSEGDAAHKGEAARGKLINNEEPDNPSRRNFLKLGAKAVAASTMPAGTVDALASLAPGETKPLIETAAQATSPTAAATSSPLIKAAARVFGRMSGYIDHDPEFIESMGYDSEFKEAMDQEMEAALENGEHITEEEAAKRAVDSMIDMFQDDIHDSGNDPVYIRDVLKSLESSRGDLGAVGSRFANPKNFGYSEQDAMDAENGVGEAFEPSESVKTTGEEKPLIETNRPVKDIDEKGLQQDLRQGLENDEAKNEELGRKLMYAGNKVYTSRKTGAQGYNPGDVNSLFPWAETPWGNSGNKELIAGSSQEPAEYEPQEGASASLGVKPKNQHFMNPFTGEHEPEPNFSADELNDLYRGDILDTMAKTRDELIHIPPEPGRTSLKETSGMIEGAGPSFEEETERFDKSLQQVNPNIDMDALDDYIYDDNGKIIGNADEGVFDEFKNKKPYTYDELRESLGVTPGLDKENSIMDSRILAKDQNIVDSAMRFLKENQGGLSPSHDLMEIFRESDLDINNPVDIIEAAKEMGWKPDGGLIGSGLEGIPDEGGFKPHPPAANYYRPEPVDQLKPGEQNFRNFDNDDDYFKDAEDEQKALEHLEWLGHDRKDLIQMTTRDLMNLAVENGFDSPEYPRHPDTKEMLNNPSIPPFESGESGFQGESDNSLIDPLDDIENTKRITPDEKTRQVISALSFLKSNHGYDTSELLKLGPETILKIAKAHGFSKE